MVNKFSLLPPSKVLLPITAPKVPKTAVNMQFPPPSFAGDWIFCIYPQLDSINGKCKGKVKVANVSGWWCVWRLTYYIQNIHRRARDVKSMAEWDGLVLLRRIHTDRIHLSTEHNVNTQTNTNTRVNTKTNSNTNHRAVTPNTHRQNTSLHWA